MKSSWTYGAEHEWGDWPLDRELIDGHSHARDDYTMVNSTGIGNDPKGKTYRFGGEINTRPTDHAYGQVEIVGALKKRYPEAVVNYRSNLHIHIGVPGLERDLAAMKRLAKYNAANLPDILDIIEPIPEPKEAEFKTTDEYEGARRRWRRRRRSHHTILPPNRLEGQLQANSVTEFHNAEPALSVEGKPLHHLQPRAAVNVRQLLQTKTIEFRHFPGTLNLKEMETALDWCTAYLDAALNDGPTATELFKKQFKKRKFPTFPPYIHWMEVRYRATCLDGSLTRDQVLENIAAIERGEFDDHQPNTLPL